MNTHQQPSSDTPLERFKEKKQELKDWLYGTVYKGYDQEETAEVVQSDVDDHFSDEWFISLLTSHSQAIRERVTELKGFPIYNELKGEDTIYIRKDDILALLNDSE